MTYTATYKNPDGTTRQCEIVASGLVRAELIALQVAGVYKAVLVSVEPKTSVPEL